MLSLISPDGRVHVAIDETCGARLASIRIDDFDILVTDGDDARAWGCYPMVPYAGRVRNAVVRLHGSEYLLPANAAPHGIHGTVFAIPWTVLDHTNSRAVLLTELDLPWPVLGTVRHEIFVTNDAVTMRLEVTAHDDMPCHVGWHPWFVKPDTYTVPFGMLWSRDDDGITTTAGVDHDPNRPMFGTYDDCFSQQIESPTLMYRLPGSSSPGLNVILDSDCSHWVVFDQRGHAVCIEPQSGPPNQINDAPVWLGFGESLSREFRIGWRNTRR